MEITGHADGGVFPCSGRRMTIWRRFGWSVFAILVLGLVGVPYAQALGSFTPIDSRMSEERLWPVTFSLTDGKVLVVGATHGPSDPWFSPAESVDIYDPATGLFEPAGSLPEGFYSQTSLRLRDGRILIVGSMADVASFEVKPAFVVYDEESGEFSPPEVGRGLGSFRLPDDRFLEVVDNKDSDGWPVSQTLSIYDLESDSLSKVGPLPIPGRDWQAVALPHDQVLLYDGHAILHYGRYLPRVVDLATGTVKIIQAARPFRAQPLVVPLPDGRILFAGGEGKGIEDLETAEIFDVSTGRFTPAGPTQPVSSGSQALVLADGRFLIFGGSTTATEIYDPETGVFTDSGDLTRVRTIPGAELLPDGRVLLVGGGIVRIYGHGAPRLTGYDTAEIFDPNGPTADVRELNLKPRRVAVRKDDWFKVEATVTNQGFGVSRDLTFCETGNAWYYIRDEDCGSIPELQPGETRKVTFKARMQTRKRRGKIMTPPGVSRRIRLGVRGQDVDVTSVVTVRVLRGQKKK